MANALAGSASPYLLQHKDNPVDWREWSPATLAQAKADDRPIVLSVGYAACHWCHVMAHESFEDEAIAGAMNRWFVNIKVDREERPDLDAVYQQALALLGQQGGWPLTMFLTPDGEPFWGGTYFPPGPRWGRPGFGQVLERVATLWRDEREKINGNRDQLVEALKGMARPQPGQMLAAEEALHAARLMGHQMDPVHGGLGAAPKFPQSPILELLWQACRTEGDGMLRKAVLHTLGRICQGGIYDHIGGGFARYSVDAQWLVPHFEKMLYDNAQLLPLLAGAWALEGNQLFRVRCEETVGWLEREMMVDGAFASSLDADSEGEEGRFYVWGEDEIDRLLGDDAPTFKSAYDVMPEGNFEGHTILNRLHAEGLPDPVEETILARCRELLLEARGHRVRPALDDKVLTDWNGLMIAGLAEAGGLLGRPEWIDLAARVFAAVRSRMVDGDRLIHSTRDGRKLEIAFLDDYAQMSRAALTLYQLTGERPYLDAGTAWLRRAAADFGSDGAWYTTAHDAPGLIVRPVASHDGPSPAANGTVAWCASLLWHLTGDDAWRAQAEGIMRGLAGDVRRNPAALPSLATAALLLEHAVQIVVIGDAGSADFEAMAAAARAAPVANRALLILDRHTSLPESHPAYAKRLPGGPATAYLCVGPVCETPIDDPTMLTQRARKLATGSLVP